MLSLPIGAALLILSDQDSVLHTRSAIPVLAAFFELKHLLADALPMLITPPRIGSRRHRLSIFFAPWIW